MCHHEHNNITKTAELGQAIWLDQISRDMIDGGEIQELIDHGLRGITTNPTIFDGAIAGSDVYDERLAEYAKDGSSAEVVFERIAVEDVRDAADILLPTYEALNYRDGFVSIEVNPHLAHDTDRTIAEARRLWSAVDRPNVMIKVPGTPEGAPAITTLISEGINVNVTLLFSLDAYITAANAYLDGVTKFAGSGNGSPARIASVASFFVSRVDTLADELLPDDSDLVGKIGIANAKLAYREYQKIFASDLNDNTRFFSLNTIGAQPQRPLWASTSVKNPEYPPTLYFDSLLGPDTVNTLPLPTVDDVLATGTIAETLTADVDKAEAQLAQLADEGVSYDEVTAQLLVEGVEKFADSWDSLMARIDAKISALTSVG